MLVAGNWKMNTDRTSAVQLARDVVGAVGDVTGVQVAVCPPAVSLDAVFEVLHGSSVRLGAQNMHYEDHGAFTGEISAGMLRSVGCHYVILGHSERRQYFGETDVSVNKKVKKAREYKLVPILCVGETLAQRDAGEENAVVQTQVEKGLAGVEIRDPGEVVLAYEPVWAIGTGRTATPAQAQAMHAFIRGLLINMYGEKVGFAMQILYGGSVKPGNAADLFAQPDVDGGLIGGASLNAADFGAIVEAAVAAS
ncbi:triose-phosphate isomerase [Rhodocaloribacter litoris]|uniref:triose-phosphate isomerase n=1 Tax=Rhodocaloribacter litoris TaxID=2558931 RepID=UPI00142051CB|nr:triose-phosphate isomerase [Rhodocaloribacter litoris]QXD15287.1 triose-phosphate isomerase [Rhodocaloribacter litoris]GIV62288.1 MAG: triosephosphate isomerase [Rhodothermaceae bacterium]